MTNRSFHARLRALASGGISAAALAAPAAIATPASAATPATASCNGISFSVLHNDSSGGVILPQGKYAVSSPNLGCKTASNYFTTFLDKYNNAIPGWKGKQIAKGWGTYTKNNSKTQFTVKWSNAKRQASATASCKGISFSVLHNDSSGGVILPQGKYAVSSPNLGCNTASNYFTTFLDKYNNAIPGWKGKQIAKGWGTYIKNNGKTQFTVKWSNAKTAS
jgi:hypothetical protein